MGTDDNVVPIKPPVGIAVTAYEAHGEWWHIGDGDAETHFDDYADWPVMVQQCADEIADHFDEAQCWTCQSPIGWNLHEAEDPYGNERTGVWWIYTAVVYNGTQAWAVCEDCAAVFEAPPNT